ncbi:ABC transporter substrate-binding protein [Parafannyhessea umbonata]|uniref:Iron complex transport system substrate-binding protein n=1 Tax=Parafannyhessea umbonata TaxID=604330 RepID=A0A1G6MQF2_9ACTN|nr:ABC transporter substrate-binding protein [Parafannyhessea umbonata]MBM6989090.1 ABC transporter substrate-binding protein [Parafannyhessea umbonata]SDC57808.1 iron complex transport system substrate-binding protein [Parafannyhessea umbonata]
MKQPSSRRRLLALPLAALLAASLLALPACGSASGAGNDASASSAASGAAKPGKAKAGEAEKGKAYTFTDDLGRKVTVKSHKRVVACMGSLADAWQLAGGTLVGASDDAFGHYAVDSSKVSGVGRSTSLNLESILALKPDFVIMTGIADGKHSTGVSQADAKSALTEAGVPVAFFKVTTFADYKRMMGTLCAITGRNDLYKKNATKVGEKIKSAVSRYSVASKSPSVLVVSAFSKGLVVQNSSGMAGAIVKDLGAVNVADEHPSLLSDFSLEAAVEANPDYVLVLAASDDAATAQKYYDQVAGSSSAWQGMDAVKEGRVTMLDAAHFLYKPNADWAESYVLAGKALNK